MGYTGGEYIGFRIYRVCTDPESYSCVRRIPETTLALLEPASAEDHSIPQNITRLKVYLADAEAFGGIGDIPIGDGDGWTCQPFPYQ